MRTSSAGAAGSTFSSLRRAASLFIGTTMKK